MKLSLPFSILISAVVTIFFGFIVYGIMDGIRIRMYCPGELQEGSCYHKDWETFPVWLFAFTGSLMAILLVSITSILQPKQRYKGALTAFIVGAFIAIPFALLVQSGVTYIIVLISGLCVVYTIKRLTRKKFDGKTYEA